jgi:hypothetical protein
LIVGLVLAFVLVCCCGGYGTLWWYEDSYVPQQREDLLRYFGAPEGFGLEVKRIGDDGIAASYVLRCQPASVCPPDPLGKLAAWATRIGAPGVTSTSLANIFQAGGSDRRNGLRWDDFEIDLALSGSVASDGSQAVFGAFIAIKGGCWSCG